MHGRKNENMPLMETKTVIEHRDDCDDVGWLTGWPDRFAFLDRLEVLLESFLKAWFGNTWGTPPLELNVVSIVDSMCKEDGGEVDVCIVTSREVCSAVCGDVFHPLCSWGEVTLWIVRLGVSMAASHC